MAQNTITIDFDPCEPPPPNGYRVIYRPKGSSEEFRVLSPNPTTTPAVIIDNNYPIGTSFEGFIMGDCGDGNYGPQQPWDVDKDASGGSQSGGGESESIPPIPEEFNYYLADGYSCEDCFAAPVVENVLVRLPVSETVHIGKFYRPVGHPTGIVYTLFLPAQPPASSVELSGLNFTTCSGACSV